VTRAAASIAVAFALAGSVATRRASADDELPPVRLAYVAPPGCPDGMAVGAAIAARAPRVRWADGAPRTIALTIVPSDAGFTGDVTLTGDGPPPAGRRLTGATCGEVAAALALVAAITLDPTSTLPPPSPPPSPSPSPSPPPSPPPPPPPSLGLAAGVSIGAQSGVGPSVSLLGRAHLEALVRPTASNALRPTIRLAALRAVAQQVDTAAGTADLSLSGARVDACPLRLALAGPLELRPCAALELGAHLGAGSRTASAASETRAWVAPGALGRAVVRVFGPITAEIEGGATFPLFRYRFYFGPDVTAFQAAPVALSASVGLGVSFP
jgi:hypothetical protein